jgi:hypothetical protein
MLDRTRGLIDIGCSGSNHPPPWGFHRLLCTTQIRRWRHLDGWGLEAYLGKTHVQRGASLLRLGPELRLLFLLLSSNLLRRSVMYQLSPDNMCGVASSRLCMAESMSPPSVTSSPHRADDSILHGPAPPSPSNTLAGMRQRLSRTGLSGQGWRTSAACRLRRPANRANRVARQARTSDGGRRRVQQKPHGDGNGKHQ